MAFVSRIRKNTRPRIFLLEAATVFYSFTASAFRSDWPSLHDDPAGLLRLTIPVAIVLITLLVRNGYGSEPRRQLTPVIDVAIAFALAMLMQVALSSFAPDLALPRWAPTQGTFVGWMFLTGLRSLFPPGSDELPARASSFLEEIQYRAYELERSIRRRNGTAYIILASLAITSAASFFVGHRLRVRAASVLMFSGALYVLFELCRSRPALVLSPDSSLVEYSSAYRRELQRQSTLLYRTWYWYFASLLPGCVLLLHGSFVYPYILLLCILLFAEIHLQVAEKLQQELAAFR